MNGGYGNGDFNGQDYSYSQAYRPSGYASRLDDFHRAYASRSHVSHRNSHQSHSASDYIDGPKHVESDRIEQHKERSNRHKPKHNHYTSRHSTEDYISPPPRGDRDDYISQDYDATHQHTYQQVPGAWASYEEPEVPLRSAPRPSHRAMYASPDHQSHQYRPANNSFDARNEFKRYDDSKAWNQDAYEDAIDIQDDIRGVEDARDARPRSEAQRGGPRSHHASVEYDSDLQTCVDSEAQQPFYTSGSDIASIPDDTTQDSLRSSSPICPGHFPSSPDGHYAHERLSNRYDTRRYASSSPRLDDSINDYTPSPAAHYHTSSSPYDDSSNIRYRESSESLVAQLRAPSPPHRNLDYARYRQSSESPVAQLRAPSPPTRNPNYPRYHQHSSTSPMPRRHISPSSSDASGYTRHRRSSRSPVARTRYLSETPSVHAGSDFEIDGNASVVESEMERLRRTGSEAYLSSDAGSAGVIINESDDDDEEGDAISDGWDEYDD